MATPQTAIQQRENYERLSDFYLRLWKQLDLINGDSKWLDVAPATQAELRADAEAILKEAAPSVTEGDVLRKDFKRTQDLVEQASQQEGGADGFREYLRDLALRYAQLADEA